MYRMSYPDTIKSYYEISDCDFINVSNLYVTLHRISLLNGENLVDLSRKLDKMIKDINSFSLNRIDTKVYLSEQEASDQLNWAKRIHPYRQFYSDTLFVVTVVCMTPVLLISNVVGKLSGILTGTLSETLSE